MIDRRSALIFIVGAAALAIWACSDSVPTQPKPQQVPTPTFVPVPSPHVPIPSPHVPVPSPHVPVPSPHVPVPSPHVPVPSPEIPKIPVAALTSECTPAVSWASADNTVLVRWTGRAAAGQEPKDLDKEEPDEPSILPGSADAPPLTVERRFAVNGNFGAFIPIASDLRRITPGEAPDFIGIPNIKHAKWWDDLAEYVALYLNAENKFEKGLGYEEELVADVSLKKVYEVFDANPMAAEVWANQYYEIALLLGMGYLDEELANKQQVEYRVSLENIDQSLTELGVTCPITVGQPLSPPENITASSDPPMIVGSDNEKDYWDPDSASDDGWLIEQGYRRWVDQSIYIGWKAEYQDGYEPATITAAAGYNVYRRVSEVDKYTNPLNEDIVLPGGNMQEEFHKGLDIGWSDGLSAEDPENPKDPPTFKAIGKYALKNPEGSNYTGSDPPDGYYFIDTNDPEQPGQVSGQVYCYAVTLIDLLGNESPKSPLIGQGKNNCAYFQDFEPPDAPVGLSAKLVGEHDEDLVPILPWSAELKWYSVEDATSYSVYRAEVSPGYPYPSNTGIWEKVNDGGEFETSIADGIDYTVFTDYSISQLPDNEDEEKDYWYRVRSWDSNDNSSALSQPVYVFLIDSFPPGKPSLEFMTATTADSHSRTNSRKDSVNQLNSKGPCLDIDIDDDTEFIQIYRKLEDGTMQLVATIPKDELDEWCDKLGAIPGSTKVEYLIQAHDYDGNYSWSDVYITVVGDDSLFDAPSIVSVTSELTQPGVVTNLITWHADLFPEFHQFNVYRFNSDQDIDSIHKIIEDPLLNKIENYYIGNVSVVKAQDLGTGFASAEFSDSGLLVNETMNSDFYYVVSSERIAGGNLSAAEKFSDPPYLAPPGEAGDGLQHALRNVGQGMWCSDHNIEDLGVRVNWDPEPEMPPSVEDAKCRPGTHGDWGVHLIFRSRSERSGYVQIAPVLGGAVDSHTPGSAPDHPYYGSPTESIDSTGGIAYLDQDADFGTYWYVVVTMDPTTGEPISATPPKSVTLDPLDGLPTGTFTSLRCIPKPPAPQLSTMMAPEKLIFGSGEKHESTVTVCSWSNSSEPARGVAQVSGEGYATFTHPDGSENYTVLVKFENVRAKDSGVVISGEANQYYPAGVQKPILISGEGLFDYSIENIVFTGGTGSSDGSKADVKLLLHDSFYLVEDGVKHGYLDLKNTPITHRFDFSVLKDLSDIPSDASNVSPSDTGWTAGLDYLVFDELPLLLLVDKLGIDPTKITAPGDIRGRYYERFKGRGIQGPIDRTPVNERVNSNDALLQQAVFTVDDFRANPDGIDAGLTSDSDTKVSWVSSVPYWMELEANKAHINIENSVITEGTVTGSGSAKTKYLHKTDSANVDDLKNLSSTFDAVKMGKGGLLTGDIKISGNASISWLENGFEIPASFVGNWNLYLPPITSLGLPARPTKLDSPTDDTSSLWDPTFKDEWSEPDTSPPWIMPGINASGSGDVEWLCLDITFDAAVDIYIRRSGVSHVIKAKIGSDPLEGNFHDYNIAITRADLGFLDSQLVYHTVGMMVKLGYPAEFDFAGSPEFDGGCPKGLTSASAGTEVTARHWKLKMLPSVAEFKEAPVEGQANEKIRLFLHGGVDLPHDDTDDWVPMRTRWEPNGLSGGTRFNEVPVVIFDGLHYLAKVDDGVVLSGPKESQQLQMQDLVSTNVNVEDLKCIEVENCPGFITYNGVITVPYFGPLKTDEGSEEVQLHVFSPYVVETESYPWEWDNEVECPECVGYIGSSGLKAEQVWISEAGLELDFPLVIAKGKDVPGLVLTGIGHTSILPKDLTKDLDLDLDLDLEMIRFDSSVVIDSRKADDDSKRPKTTIFTGLSSVPASVRAVSETLGVVKDEPPSSGDLQRWFDRHVDDENDNNSDNALDQGDMDLYVGVGPGEDQKESVGGCTNIVQQIWSGFEDKTYEETYNVLHSAIGEEPEGCFNIPAIEAKLSDDKTAYKTKVTLKKLLRLGGGVGSALQFDEGYKLQFNLVHGHVVFTDSGPGTDFERFDLDMRTKISESGTSGLTDKEHIFLLTPQLSFSATKWGKFEIGGKDVQADIFAFDVDRADFKLVISTVGDVGIDGGVTYYDDVEFGILVVTDISGVMGFGMNKFYVGMNGNGSVKLDAGSADVGAGLLLGRINDSSLEVLKEQGFDELVGKFPDVGNDPMTGIYVRGLGEVPIISDGCALSLDVGAEVEVWFFTGTQSAYGGSLRGYAYGKALCLISARGDVTLTLSKTGTKNVDGVDKDIWEFNGDGWVCGGIGWCSPSSWGKKWSGRWWDDGWCAQAGAAAEIGWRTDDGWSYSLDADYE